MIPGTFSPFLLTPLREGRQKASRRVIHPIPISTHAPAGGATDGKFHIPLTQQEFLLTPLREGRLVPPQLMRVPALFLLTPLREGRPARAFSMSSVRLFLLTPLREGRLEGLAAVIGTIQFLLTPLREGRPICTTFHRKYCYFYSRPCGRGDASGRAVSGDPPAISTHAPAGGATETGGRNQQPGNQFLLTPLREGRRSGYRFGAVCRRISTHAPAGGATENRAAIAQVRYISTHAPAGGATLSHRTRATGRRDFYSRPCGRGDEDAAWRK